MSELALRLIEENKKTRAPFLDLGNCGLTEVPEELGELVWLEGLSFFGWFPSSDLIVIHKSLREPRNPEGVQAISRGLSASDTPGRQTE